MKVSLPEVSVYFDFDGTVTTVDAIDGFFQKFVPSLWKKIDDDVEKKLLTPRQALSTLLAAIPTVTTKQMQDYLQTIEIDPGFRSLVSYLQQSGSSVFIISDGLDAFIRYVLKHRNLDGITVYSNYLYFEKGWRAGFPFEKQNCKPGLGVCKCDILRKQTYSVYIGDGRSDFCAADRADLLFAKNALRDHCERMRIPYVPFENLFDVKQQIENRIIPIAQHDYDER